MQTAVDGGPLDELRGLSAAEVNQRQAEGRTNDVPNPTSRTFGQIISANVFTLFNALLGGLLLLILWVKEYRDALFGIVLVLNAAIGIVQETRAKRTLDRLTLLNAPKVTVRRDSASIDVTDAGLVIDDLVELGLGDQVTVDGVILEAVGLEIDESLLTGEADPLVKGLGDEVLSGSFVVAGTGCFRATKVGRDTYAYQINEDASRFSKVRSELNDGINRILKVITILIVPVGILLVVAQIRSHDGGGDTTTEAVQKSVAGMVAMVPEGLVLLTSTAYALGVLRLAKKKVLTQELAAIEGLARVDVLCVDKTGTLTEGKLVLSSTELLVDADGQTASDDDRLDGLDAGEVLAAMAAADLNPNASMAAIGDEYDRPPGWTTAELIPFSSARKWSATSFADGRGDWVFGAPDILTNRSDYGGNEVMARVNHYAERGRRVLLLASAPDGLRGEELPDRLDAAALVVLEEKVRDDARATVDYFGEQGVAIKVISGDNPVTVGAVATRCGIDGADHPIDARTLPDNDDLEGLAAALEANSVFGRVTPQQKRAMVHALQLRGHEVAMTGDGVNDTLALKDAEIGVAMGAGSAAARAVARFVLIDNSFAVFPSVVAEGRRVIANVERVANLFVTKTVYAVLLAIAIGVSGQQYPFVPRHFTVISALTIGVPAFFLALAPNSRRARTGFLPRVVRFAGPAGVVVATVTMSSYLLLKNTEGVSLAQAQSGALVSLFVVTLWILGILARPFVLWRVGLVAAMALAFAIVLWSAKLRDYFAIALPPREDLVAAIGIAAIGCLVLEVGGRLMASYDRRRGQAPLVDMELVGRLASPVADEQS
jgi:cation-transporting ATPase E